MFTTWLLALALLSQAISGVVTDPTGAAISGATVIVRAPSGAESQTLTGADGRFSIDVAAGGTLIVRAGGFAEARQPIGSAADLDVVLAPAGVLETVTVTPGRGEQRLGDVPASVHLLSSEEIKASPAVVADDVLRQIPTFSLFRRTSSLSSHPTAQGVSLRGIGPSGVSRTLVLVDGIPFNDPFGGWVYWTRVPLEDVERVEVVDGSSSSLYGNYAMGGVIQIMTSRPSRASADLRAQYGNRNSPKVDFSAGDVWGKLGVAVDGSFFDTDGFPIVLESERGLVDTNAKVQFGTFNAKANYSPAANLNLFARVGRFDEERVNGKVSTIDGTDEQNDTSWTYASGGARAVLPDQSTLDVRLVGDFETFRSNFLAVPAATPARSLGRMTLNQRVPITGIGGNAVWSRAFGARHVASAGTDWRWVDGDSEEDALDAVLGQTATLRRISGGTQRSVGGFVQDVFKATDDLTLTVSARVDHWRNYDAHNYERNLPADTPTANDRELPDKSDTVASPRLAAAYRVNDRVNVWSSLGWGFRAPTLNELYRQFRVGALLTLANEDLGPERLRGGEIGLNVAATSRLTVRTTWYDNRVRNPVSNVTIATNTQQRQNLGRTRIWGLQSDADYRIGTAWHISGGYLFNQARVTEADANPGIVDKFLPQVPRHRGSVRVAYVNPRVVTATLGVQFIGRQFDDDLNERTVPGESEPGLPGYGTVDLSFSRQLHDMFDVFLGVQNLFDKTYIVGTLPTTIGSPRLVNAGVRVRFSGR